MNCHLVAVEVSVERGTNKRMKLNGLTFYQDRFKSLDTQPVQRRSTVQHNRMLFNYILQYIPNLRLELLHHLLCVLDIVSGAIGNKLLHNERLKQLNSHFLWQTTLINL